MRYIQSNPLVEAAADRDRPRPLLTVAQSHELLRKAQQPHHLHLPKAQDSADIQRHRMPKERVPRYDYALEVGLEGSRMRHSEQRRTVDMRVFVRIHPHPLQDTH